MSCTSPILAINMFKSQTTGKNVLKIYPRRVDVNIADLERKYGKDNVLTLPCGKCDACKLEHRFIWSTRAFLESLDHEHNCFVTLTYSPENCPEKLQRKHFTLFTKKLRNAGIQVRYFGCGEYGSHTQRPHYHVILFGYFPSDAKPIGRSNGHTYYNSKELDKFWSYGFVTVGEVSPESCGYVAGYCDKKIGDSKGFIAMSNRPGIGFNYYQKHKQKLFKEQHIILKNGNVVKLPPYFKRKLDEDNYYTVDISSDKKAIAESINNQRMNDLGLLYKDELFKVMESQYENKLKRCKRRL